MNLNLQSQRVVLVTLTSSSTDTFAGTGSPTIAAYSQNVLYVFQANTVNTGACSLNIDGVGAKTIKKVAGGVTTDLADNDIRSGQVCIVSYDGTNLQLQSTLGNAGGGSFDPASPGAIGGTTPAAGTFTTLRGNASVEHGTVVAFFNGILNFGSTATLGWAFNADFWNTKDIGLARAAAGILKITDGSTGGGILALGATSGSITVPTDSAGIRAKNDPAELYAWDEGGNETLISPHSHSAPASFYDSPFDQVTPSLNRFLALVYWTSEPRKAAGRADYMLVETFEAYNARLSLGGTVHELVQDTWEACESRRVAARDAERAAWTDRKTAWEADPTHQDVPFAETEPELYVAKPVPAWLTAQLNGRAAYLTRRDAIASQSADRLTKRTNTANAVATLRQWKLDADAALVTWDTSDTTANKLAKLKVVLDRFGKLSDKMADFIQAQGLDQ